MKRKTTYACKERGLQDLALEMHGEAVLEQALTPEGRRGLNGFHDELPRLERNKSAHRSLLESQALFLENRTCLNHESESFDTEV